MQSTSRDPALLRVVLVLVAAIYAADWMLPSSVAAGGLFILPVWMSLWSGERRTTTRIAALCTVLVLSRALWPGSEPSWTVWASRAVILFAIWVTAHLSWMRALVERELTVSRDTIDTTLRSIADAVIACDSRGQVDFLNHAAEVLVGVSQREAHGKPLDELFQLRSGGSPSGLFEEAQGEDVLPARRELEIVTLDGRKIPVEASSAPLRGPRPGRGGRVLVFRDISERRRYEKAVEHLAYRDALTGLPNRNSFLDRLHLEVGHAKRHGEPLALLFLDLDGFKDVNDTHGHQAGDLLLKQVAKRMTETVRGVDTVARLGGDEFTMILARVGNIENAKRVAKKLVTRISQPYLVDGHEARVSPSIGISLFPEDAEDVDALLRFADQAMYQAKERGGSSYAAFGDSAQPVHSSPPL